MCDPGQYADRRHAADSFQILWSRGQQRWITAELVKDESPYPRLPRRWKQRPRAVEMREGTSSVDVGHEQYRSICQFSDRHVDDVIDPEIGLGGATCAFNNDDVVVAGERFIGFDNVGPEVLGATSPRLTG